jgi:hypothetical protein
MFPWQAGTMSTTSAKRMKRIKPKRKKKRMMMAIIVSITPPTSMMMDPRMSVILSAEIKIYSLLRLIIHTKTMDI